MARLIYFGLLIFLVGCTTAPERTEEPLPKSFPLPSRREKPRPQKISIDYFRLQKALGLERAPRELGYEERSFDTCEVGYGFPRAQDCHQEYFVVIHFQLMCRESEGTVSEVITENDMIPIANTVNWTLKGTTGHVKTDSRGYGQIVTTSPASLKSERLKLAVGSENLYMSAGDIRRVVAPQPWCRY